MKPFIDTMIGVGTNSGYGTLGAIPSNSYTPQYGITTYRGSSIPYSSRLTFDDYTTFSTITIGDPHSTTSGQNFDNETFWVTEDSGNKYVSFNAYSNGPLRIEGGFESDNIGYTDNFVVSFMIDNTEYYSASYRSGDDDDSMNSVVGAITMDSSTRNVSNGISTTSFHYKMVDHGTETVGFPPRWSGQVKPQAGEFGFNGSNQGLPSTYDGSGTGTGNIAGIWFNAIDFYGNDLSAHLTQIMNNTTGRDQNSGTAVNSRPQIWMKLSKIGGSGDEDYDDVIIQVLPQSSDIDCRGYFGGTMISPTTDNKYYPTETTAGGGLNNAIPNLGTIWFQTDSSYTGFMNKTVAGHDATGLTVTEMSVKGTQSDGTADSYTPNFGGITQIIIAYSFSDTNDYAIANRATSFFNATCGCTIRLERTSEDGATFSTDGSGRFGLYRITDLDLTIASPPYVTYTVENIADNSSKDFVVDEPVKVSFCEYESTVQFRCYNNSQTDGIFQLGGNRIEIDNDDVFYSHALNFTNNVRNTVNFYTGSNYYAKIDTPKHGLILDCDIVNYPSETEPGFLWEDKSGWGNNLIAGDDVTVTGGGTDTGYFTLDGSNDSVIYLKNEGIITPVGHNSSSFGSSPSQTRNRLDAYTMIIVFKLDTAPATTDGGDVQQLISAGGPTSTDSHSGRYRPWEDGGFPWGIHIGKSGTTIAATFGGAETTTWGTGITIGTTSWYFQAVRYSGRSAQPFLSSGNQYKGYKYGAEVRQRGSSTSPSSSNASVSSYLYKPIPNNNAYAQFSIGAYKAKPYDPDEAGYQVWTNHFKGKVAAVKVYNYPLSYDEIDSIYNLYKDRYNL